MSPSTSQAIRHGVSGYLALSAAGWYHGLKKLADSAELRAKMGSRLYNDFQRDVTPSVLNHKLVEFIRQLPPTKSPPLFDDAILEEAEKESDGDTGSGLAAHLIERAKRYIGRLF